MVSLFCLFLLAACSSNHQEEISKKNAPPCFFIRAAEITGDSMEPFLYDKEKVSIAWDYYNCHEPERGDIVVAYFASRDHPFIKTLVALPGDSISFEKNNLLVNNIVVVNSEKKKYSFSEQEKKQLLKGTNDQSILQEKYHLILGDNLSNTFSSRKFGPLFRNQIVGKVIP